MDDELAATLRTVGIDIGVVLFVLLCCWILVRFSGFYRYIPNDSYGVLERIINRKGSIRGSGLIALDGRVGFQPEVLRGGPHFFMPFLFRIHLQKLITVRTIAYVFARDGELRFAF